MFHLVSSAGVGARVQAAGDARERPPAPDAGERVRAGRESAGGAGMRAVRSGHAFH